VLDPIQHRQSRFDCLEPTRIRVEQLSVATKLCRHVRRLLLQRLQPGGLVPQTRVELGRCSHGGRRARDTVFVEGVDRLLSELCEASRVPRRLTVGG
jgi:hypothetical protein